MKSSRPVRIVTMTVTAVYVGDHHGPEELVDATEEWLAAALEDRDELNNAQITGHVTVISRGYED